MARTIQSQSAPEVDARPERIPDDVTLSWPPRSASRMPKALDDLHPAVAHPDTQLLIGQANFIACADIADHRSASDDRHRLRRSRSVRRVEIERAAGERHASLGIKGDGGIRIKTQLDTIRQDDRGAAAIAS